ncbi:hypothetical protein [Mangrovimonas futianensis]|uniref:hypothetical protein n=1 Tax=Mangrovimonas futianensis TaxID=2895523 RepID=UPI001E4F388E|nr:hypothetical protein [Mangrovimonas futianensis]MCF1421519.1 hypothetical protein [Mangrovimonas futianensis]
MIPKLLLYFIFITGVWVNAQNQNPDNILKEGKLLYRLEKGSWYGTDHMLENFPNKNDSIGGYLSYETPQNKINTIFFSRFDSNKILIRYEFDSIPKPEPSKIDSLNRNATLLEKNLILMRKDASSRVYSNKDQFFTFYENTALNFIPVISKKERAVFIITGPQVSGVVLIGNDYKLNYDNNNKFVNKKKIHNSILQFPYRSENDKSPITTTFHSHLITEFISSTDICTLLLYKDFLEWEKHYVIHKKEVSIFDLKKETLFTMKKKAWDKINNHEENKK